MRIAFETKSSPLSSVVVMTSSEVPNSRKGRASCAVHQGTQRTEYRRVKSAMHAWVESGGEERQRMWLSRQVVYMQDSIATRAYSFIVHAV